MDSPIHHLSLCTGYGGIDLGLRAILPTCRTVAAVEIEAFAIANLVAKMEEGKLDPCPIYTDLRSFNGAMLYGLVDILSGGFPCQPFSRAGKRRGEDDERHLWPHIARIIDECLPRLVFLENVEGIISAQCGGKQDSVLHHVLTELEERGYMPAWGIFSAAEVGSPHQRKRVFILAEREGRGQRLIDKNRAASKEKDKEFWRVIDECKRAVANTKHCSDATERGERSHPAEGGEEWNADGGSEGYAEREESVRGPGGDTSGTAMADSISQGLERQPWDVFREEGQGGSGPDRPAAETCVLGEAWPARPGEAQHRWEPKRTVEPGLGGNTYGSGRVVDRLRLLGNGVVPHVAAKAFITLLKELADD